MNAISHPLSHHKDVTLLFLKHLRPAGAAEQPARAKALGEDLDRLGPVFRRIAHAFSFRSDLLPDCYLEAFHQLPTRDQCFPHEVETMEQVEKIVEDELGGRFSRTFATFEEAPCRFTMAGQVHRATLVGGREVTVKVQRPTVRARIVRDLDSVAEICTFLDKQVPSGKGRRLSRVADRLRVNVMREMDYRGEMTAIAELGQSFAGFPKLRLPVAIENYTSSRVLTSVRAPAEAVNDSADSLAPDARGPLATELVALFVELSLLRGIFPTELGPERLSITQAGSLLMTEVKSTARLGFRTRSNLLRLLAALHDGDSRVAAAAVANISGQSSGAANLEALAREIQPMTTGADSPGVKLVRVARLAARHDLLLPQEIGTFARTLEDLGRTVLTISPGSDPASILRTQIETIQPERVDKTIPFPATLGSAG